MAESKDEVQSVADLLAKTKVEQVNIVSFKGKSLKLNSADDGKFVLFYSYLMIATYNSLKFAMPFTFYINLGPKHTC